MVILLNGSSPIARAAIAEKLRGELENWSHLPLEALSEAVASQGMQIAQQPELLLRVACHCTEEMRREGMHTLLSADDIGEMLPLLREELGGDVVAVHLGDSENPDQFDFTIDTSVSNLNDIVNALIKFIKETPQSS